jgi:hypothetical protein
MGLTGQNQPGLFGHERSNETERDLSERVTASRSRDAAPQANHPRRPGRWTRLKAWFGRPAPKRDSYVSNVTDPDDRRFIPRH